MPILGDLYAHRSPFDGLHLAAVNETLRDQLLGRVKGKISDVQAIRHDAPLAGSVGTPHRSQRRGEETRAFVAALALVETCEFIARVRRQRTGIRFVAFPLDRNHDPRHTRTLVSSDSNGPASLAPLAPRDDGELKMAEGTIKRLTDKGFGFIENGTGQDMFFHQSAVEGVRFSDLREGQKVTYNEGRGPKGPRAENVRVVG